MVCERIWAIVVAVRVCAAVRWLRLPDKAPRWIGDFLGMREAVRGLAAVPYKLGRWAVVGRAIVVVGLGGVLVAGPDAASASDILCAGERHRFRVRVWWERRLGLVLILGRRDTRTTSPEG